MLPWLAAAMAVPFASTLGGCHRAEPVRVDLYMMSKCPFGNQALKAALGTVELLGADSVTLSLHHVGRLERGVASSARGEADLMGDRLQLCAGELSNTPQQWHHFLGCLSERREALPSGWEACAANATLDVARMRDCAEGKRGNELLTASMGRSAADRIDASPTILLDGKAYQGGRSARMLALSICQGATRLAACGRLPGARTVPITVVVDRRCDEPSCAPKAAIELLTSSVPGAAIHETQWDSELGKGLRERTRYRFLPFAVLGTAANDDSESIALLGGAVQRLPTDELWLPMGTKWDPTREACSDRTDNDGDGAADCADSECAPKLACRPHLANSVDLFYAPFDQFSMRAASVLSELSTYAQGRNAPLAIRLHPVGKVTREKVTSINGPEELVEVRRQLCVQTAASAHPEAVLEYVLCRDQTRGARKSWLECVRSGIDRELVAACSEAGDSLRAAEESFAEARALDVSQIPHLLIDNRHPLETYSPQAVARELCKFDADSPFCNFSEPTRVARSP